MMDKYKQGFQEEARDLLVELESALLELDQRRDDPEVVGRAFRALHTIKGSGAMFGFDDIARFTHNLETAFDLLRNGRLEVTPDLISLSLAGADQIKAMLDESAGHGAADPGRSVDILAKLRKLTGAPEPVSVAVVPEVSVAPPPPDSGVVRDWRIQFRPAPDLILNGANPLLLLRELRQLGSLRVTADFAAVPSLADLDPERCYIAWEMVLSTASEIDAIRDVFIFVEDSCELTIEPVEVQAIANSTAPTPMGEQRAGCGRRAADPPTTASSIRVAADRVDKLVNLVGELVTVQARLGALAARREDPEMLAVSEEIERLTTELRENSMSIRMLPLRATFERFRRLVHDLSRDLHKEVELSIEGADTELDKTVIEQLNDPLMHLIRNSMDHGIEAPEVRRAHGKSEIARIHLSARHSGAQVLISVADDGKGIDAEAVRASAIEKALITADAKLNENEIFSLVMAPGFSTARQVSDLSGRGVGMDVVRRSVEALRGTLGIASKTGEGTSVTLRLPLTLAIIDGLLVRVGRAHFVLPLANTLECVELTHQANQEASTKHIANVRGELIPYIRLSEYFRTKTERPEREQIMIAETEHGRYGFVVDEVLGHHPTVIKNLGRIYQNVEVVSGATILGDGTVALILDPNRLVQNVIRKLSQRHRSGVRSGGGAGRSSRLKAGSK